MEIREGLPDDLGRLIDFVELVDHEFVPPLSLRPGGIYDRVSGTLAKVDSNFLIGESHGRVVGAVGYRKNWNGTEEVMGEAYISFIAVHPVCRGQNIARLLDRALAKKLWSDRMTNVSVTTWSTNPGAYRCIPDVPAAWLCRVKDLGRPPWPWRGYYLFQEKSQVNRDVR